MSVDIDTNDIDSVQVIESAMGIEDPTERQLLGQIDSDKFWIDEVRSNSLILYVYDNQGFKIKSKVVLESSLNRTEREDLREQQQRAFASD
ncbi:hypothetical protein [Halorubrum distributum]|uniref:hypothetical protein n=1 Tax=Halorubrum distributum TaxID=29283 RepID=UPI0019553CF5|nr:hypothetical protein [Halorubrum arcis]